MHWGMIIIISLGWSTQVRTIDNLLLMTSSRKEVEMLMLLTIGV